MYAFELERPKTVAGAAKALKKRGALALGGGQTLIPALKSRLASPKVLVSLAHIATMKGVALNKDGTLSVKGGTTHAQVAKEAKKHFKALAGLAGRIGDPAVRNRGTVGGSLANNDPSACYPAAALATGATIVTDKRKIKADAFFEGMFSTALGTNEIITEVRFPIPDKAAYEKFLQPASRFALTGVFVAKYKTGVRVAVTGASEEGVFRWAEAEAALTKSFTPEAVKALKVSPKGMIGDLHGTPEYRANLVKVLTARAVAAAK
jgi:carbon-monoxide dehydrogenase medium subunit